MKACLRKLRRTRSSCVVTYLLFCWDGKSSSLRAILAFTVDEIQAISLRILEALTHCHLLHSRANSAVVPNLRHEEAVAMGKHRVKPNYRRRSLRLPDLDHCKRAVLNSLGSPASRRVYEFAIDQFIAWYCSEPRLAFNRIVVMRYRMYL